MKLSELAQDALDAAQDQHIVPVEIFVRVASTLYADRQALLEQVGPLRASIEDCAAAFERYFDNFGMVQPIAVEPSDASIAIAMLERLLPAESDLDPLSELAELPRISALTAAISRGDYDGQALAEAYEDLADFLEEVVYCSADVELGVLAELELALVG